LLFCEAEQTIFASFSMKKKTTFRPIVSFEALHHQLLRGKRQTPRVCFTESWVWIDFLQSRTNAFCFFFWKKKSTSRPIVSFGNRYKPAWLRIVIVYKYIF
jgi:hypothetical protein